jgi:transporter family-2 protein
MALIPGIGTPTPTPTPSDPNQASLAVLAFQVGLAVLCGVATAYQPGINAKFAKFAGSSIHGGVLNFAVGLVAMLVVSMALRAGIPDHQRLATGPWWMWVGGLCGAFFVTLSLILVPKMGTTSYLAAMIAGQFLASLIIDHYGHVGLAASPVTPSRLIGVGLIVVGVLVVVWGKRPAAVEPAADLGPPAQAGV